MDNYLIMTQEVSDVMNKIQGAILGKETQEQNIEALARMAGELAGNIDHQNSKGGLPCDQQEEFLELVCNAFKQQYHFQRAWCNTGEIFGARHD